MFFLLLKMMFWNERWIRVAPAMFERRWRTSRAFPLSAVSGGVSPIPNWTPS